MQYANPDIKFCQRSLKRNGHVLKYCGKRIGAMAKELYDKGYVLEIFKNKLDVYELYCNNRTTSLLMSYNRNDLNEKIELLYHSIASNTYGSLFDSPSVSSYQFNVHIDDFSRVQGVFKANNILIKISKNDFHSEFVTIICDVKSKVELDRVASLLKGLNLNYEQ
jgi:hypothetical protein